MSLHSLAPFLLDMTEDPDMNLSDLDTALRSDFERQNTVSAWLKGDLPYNAVLDMASDYGVDAYDYEDMINSNVDALIAQNLFIDDIERVMPTLWLPNTI
jgi:hypothetical protein